MHDIQQRARPGLSMILIVAATLGLALCGGLAGGLPRFVVTAPMSPGAWQGFVCWAVAALAVAAMVLRNGAMAMLLAAIWIVIAVADGVAALATDLDITSFVAPVECLLIGLTLLAGVLKAEPRWKAVTLSQTVIAALALLLFGIVHIARRQDISALVPHWMPMRQTIPFLSGTWLIAVGLLLLPRASRRIAACLAALLFASWLPLVHLPRLAADVRSPFEWQFALVAVALGASFAFLATAGRDVYY